MGVERRGRLELRDVKVEDYIAVVFPRGQINSDILRVNETAVQTVRDFVAKDKTVAAMSLPDIWVKRIWLLIDTP